MEIMKVNIIVQHHVHLIMNYHIMIEFQFAANNFEMTIDNGTQSDNGINR